MELIFPKPLTYGDKIALLAPCSPVRRELLHTAADFIRELGYLPELYPSCFCGGGYMAGDESLRAGDINRAFSDPDVRGIVAIRGGYGGARLAKALDYDAIRANPKVFCGFSDVTALHIILNKFCGMTTFHTPMPSNSEVCADKFSRSSFADILRGRITGELCNPDGRQLEALCQGRAFGRLVGGNLTVIASTVGTEYEIDANGCILFLEDVNEPTYAIDRSLIQLRDSGILSGCAGVILGTWSGCAPMPELYKIFTEIFSPLGIPIIAGLQCGHSVPSISIPLGVDAEICADGGECRVLTKLPEN